MKGIGFMEPGGGEGGFFSSIFDVIGGAAEALPTFTPMITQFQAPKATDFEYKPAAQTAQSIGQPAAVVATPRPDYMPMIILLLGALIVVVALKR